MNESTSRSHEPRNRNLDFVQHGGIRLEFRMTDLAMARAACEAGYLSLPVYLELCNQSGGTMTISQDAELREQIAGSCRLIARHAEGLVSDASAIVTMPAYKTDAEDMINEAERVIARAAVAIARVKLKMGEKQLEPT
jgi:hypothetical protein